MPTHCNPDLFGFAPVEDRSVVAAFDGGAMTSDAGALLLGAADRAVGLIDRFAACFVDHRDGRLIEHELRGLVGQRVFGIALGYEDLIDHDTLRHDPVMAVLAGKLRAKRRGCAAQAGKSTLNRLELGGSQPGLYHKIGHRPAAIEAVFVEQFVAAQRRPPARIVLDLDAADDPLHGQQEGRFFHGYYDAWCYLPLYIFCGRHLLAAKLRRANIDASAGAVDEVARIVGQLRRHWPRVRILLRADAGFAREALMGWCEANGVDYLFGLARNPRLAAALEGALAAARGAAEAKGRPARRYRDFLWSTRDSRSRRRRACPREGGGRQGGVDRRQGQSALRGDLAGARRGALPPALRDAVLRPRRDGEPDQGMPARPVRRPHIGRYHARQPAPAVVRLDGLCAALRAAPDRPGQYPPRQGKLRLDPAQAAEDRRPGAHQRAADQARHGLDLSLPERVPDRPRPIIRRRGVSGPTEPVPPTAQEQHRTDHPPRSGRCDAPRTRRPGSVLDVSDPDAKAPPTFTVS